MEPNTEGSSVLGLQWTVTDDSLQVCRGTNKEVETPITQRKILSLVSSVFDPIGLFAPFSVHMRRLLKGIWTKNGQHWDNEVEPSEKEEFLRWKEQLPIVAETSIDRRYFNKERDKVELHVFADASEDTMCAVAYLRSQPKKYLADLAFVIGECRVAPMRHLSIPRLELQTAVMAVRLKEQIVKEHEMKINSCSFWSDSTTVLQWIHSSHRKQQVFVANRVAEILDTTDVSQWKHVSGINNPADIGTRAINIEELKRSEWLTGPVWLKRPESELPQQVNLTFASDEENIPSSVFMIQAEEKKAVIQWERFSNFNRLVNTVAYVQQALNKHRPAILIVSIEERRKAKATIFKLLQQEQFGEEMKSLKAEKEIPKGIKILQFSPFLDEEGLIRAKSRIGKSQLDFNAKHPILLHWKHHEVEFFLRNEHKDYQHEGTEHVRNIVQQKMWILGIRNALRSIKNKCITCRKGGAQTIAPVMAGLSEERLDASTAFTNVGVDYFGPFIVKIGRKNEKRWCCLFTCLTMRAVHIEVVPKLDTDSCLNAITRFIARRGKPSTIISDNGTNFVGAEREFAGYVAAWNKEGIKEHPERGIRWKFNPPAAPHFGGVWEWLVRSCKKAMYAKLGNRSVTEDALSTTMCIVEQTLNARPLTPVSSDVNDLEALIPNHFLLGNRNVCLPCLPSAEEFVDHRKLFRQTQAYANLIWDRFRKEYLPTLNNRQKWRSTANETLKEGDLVWLIEDSDKRGYYNLGRVAETIDGSDGVIRSAIVRTNDGVYKRPVVKLAPVLHGKDVFAMENRAGDIAAELINSEIKLNSASKSFQALKLE